MADARGLGLPFYRSHRVSLRIKSKAFFPDKSRKIPRSRRFRLREQKARLIPFWPGPRLSLSNEDRADTNAQRFRRAKLLSK
jgi:hypothetical protein